MLQLSRFAYAKRTSFRQLFPPTSSCVFGLSRELQISPLQGIVKALRDGEEILVAVDQSPFG
jgi:hypothetical protein